MVDWTLFVAFVAFAFTSAFTPGPNNFMLMSSGALFGFKKTIPHVMGVAVGFNFVMLAALLGMGVVIEAFPWLLIFVKVAGAAWLAWLGVKFFNAAIAHKQDKSPTSEVKSVEKPEKSKRSRPFKFYEAVLFQWVNPKGLIMALAAAGAYVGISSDFKLRTLLICGTFFIMGVSSASTWAVAGSALNRLMSQGRSAIVLNIIMGLLLFATAAMILTAHTGEVLVSTTDLRTPMYKVTVIDFIDCNVVATSLVMLDAGAIAMAFSVTFNPSD